MNRYIQANGNESIALSALSVGIDYFSHYPGSPVNFIEPALKKYARQFNRKVIFNDALNEHVAVLAAGGASFTGARSMVVMKHVGLNIAADPMTYLAYTGVKGGMVVVIGTDPGANASTGELDVHWYARMCNIPLFEPVTVNESFRLFQEGIALSEKYHLPVMIFIPARLAYDSEIIKISIDENARKTIFKFEKDKEKYINVGVRNITNHKRLLDSIKSISDNEEYIKIFGNADAKTLILTRGLTFSQVFECLTELNLFDQFQLINLDLVFPAPAKMLCDILRRKKEILVVEDQDGFLEEEIKMKLFNTINCNVFGKDIFPAYGEIDINRVFKYFTDRFNISSDNYEGKNPDENIPERLGTFCEGCPHRAVFYVIEKVQRNTPGIIGGDIGCSSLPPFRADWLMCMNAGIGISQGIAHVKTGQVNFSTGGDGSFFHGGLLSLQNAVKNKIDLIHIVLDNKTIAMTGHQVSPTANTKFNAKNLLKNIGVDRIYRVGATNVKRLEKILRNESVRKGVRVIWVNGKCSRINNEITELKKKYLVPFIKSERCGDCRVCYMELSCPAIIELNNTGSLFIDLNSCMRCGTCKKICPKKAIRISYFGLFGSIFYQTKRNGQ
jgi:indolepyruvate ferredoxin oxidoreductase alpha subunit